MIEFKLFGGEICFIDDEDHCAISAHRSWSYVKSGNKKYVKTNHIYMHRILVKAKKGQCVDHINGNTLDNRKSNLRLCTYAQNAANRLKHKNKSSKFKGVSFNKDRKVWSVSIYVNYRQIYLGSYVEEKEAAIIYNEFAKKYFGEFACLNQI